MLNPTYFNCHCSREPGVPRATSVPYPGFKNQEDKRSPLSYCTNHCQHRIPRGLSVANPVLETNCELQKGEGKKTIKIVLFVVVFNSSFKQLQKKIRLSFVLLHLFIDST